MNSIDIHDIKEIERKLQKHTTSTKRTFYCLEIIVENKDGHRTQINLFADSKEALIIHESSQTTN